jgi:hypothetical protein
MKINNLSKNLLIFLTILSFQACGGGENNNNGNPNPIENNSNAIKINEILASNKETIKDPDFEKYADYIELYNSSDTVMDLEGFGLADKEDADIWKFPKGTTIEAKSYLLVWADKKNSGLHTNFKLSSSGESVILYNKAGEVIDKIDFTTQKEDIAITKDKDNKIVFIKPTPNQANNIEENKKDAPVDDTINKPTSEVYISELMASNVQTKMDEDFYKFSDWIELHNQTNHDIVVGDYKLADEGNSAGWSIPSNTTIPANGYLIVWADDKVDTPREDGKSKTELHTNFKLSDKSESLSLYDETGKLIDKVNFKKQKADISYGRDKKDNTWGYMKPTFGQENDKVYEKKDRADKPNIAMANNTITLSTDDGGAIYYTTDGSKPTKNSKPYQNPISVTNTIVIKSISYKDGYLPSKVKTETYLNTESTLPIVSLSMDDKYLTDDNVGIYTKGKNGIVALNCYNHMENKPENYANFNRSWKRPVYIEYFDTNKSKIFELGSDIAISGQCSRYIPKKSFSFELNGKYGDKKLKQQLYKSKPKVTSVKDFKLRSGQGGFELGDILSVAIAKSGNLNIDYQGYQTVRMFMNGEYWGVYNIREKKGKDFIKSNYPDIDDVDIIAHILSQDVVKHGDKTEFDKLYKFVTTNDLSTNDNYNKIFTMIDKNNFLDYMTFMIYSANRDWVNNNTRMWREKKEGATWRWMLDDLDNCFRVEYVNENFFTFVTNSPTFLGYLFKDLLKNSTFKQELKNRFNKHLDTTFSEANIVNLLNQQVNERINYMDLENSKWGISQSNLNSYKSIVEQFAKDRKAVIQTQLNSL